MKNLDVNPYTRLINTLPETILVNSDSLPEAHELEALNRVCSGYSKIITELGSGSGGHLIQRASLDPETAYIGFELRYKRAFKTAEKALKSGLKNAFVMRTNAAHLEGLFKPGTLDGIYMNFPDPWDRKRWKKHRMAGQVFFESAARLLKPAGFFSFKTDHQQLFIDTLELISSNASFRIEEKTFDLYASEFVKGNIQSEFEKLFVYKKLPIYYFKAKIV